MTYTHLVLVNDDWEENELIDLKQKTVSEFLFGLQTTEKLLSNLMWWTALLFASLMKFNKS